MPTLDYSHEQGIQSPCLPGVYVLERETDNWQLIHILISNSDKCYADNKKVKSETCVCMCVCVCLCAHVSFR